MTRSRTSSALAACGLLLVMAGSPPRAHAQGASTMSLGDPSERALRPGNGYWSVGQPRLFFATRNEAGPSYAKPYVSFGYGMPHWIWAGIDVNAIITLEMVQAYGGLRAATPLLDLAWGIRDTKSFDKPFLPREPNLSAEDVYRAEGPGARYWAWEAEGVAVVPLPHSAVLIDFIAVHTLDVPEGRALYDESYRAIVNDALFFDLRAGIALRLLNESALKVGLVSETVFGTGRGVTERVGAGFVLQLTDHLECSATLTVPVYSPDRLGVVLGSYAAGGLRYRTATGEPKPEPPWGGRFIPW